jgi:3-oxoacyl-[acyl-carrier-protein] synthase-3
MKNSKIIGVGHYVPERIVTNFDLEKMMDTSDAWIRERTGIEERHFAEAGKDTASSMGAAASRRALKMAGLTPNDIDFIIFATLSADYLFPGSGCPMQEQLGISGIGAMDIRNQCTGFIYALTTADQFIKTGMYKNILVVGSELQSFALDLTTRGRDMSVLFGDGAGAAVLTACSDNQKGILAGRLHADGRYIKELWIEDPGFVKKPRLTHEMIDSGTIYPSMNGKNVFKHAVTKFPAVIREVLEDTGYTPDDLDLVIPHQANKRITEAVQKRLNLPEKKVFSNIHKYGNTTAASIPIALSEALEQNLIKDNSLLCLAAFGSGFTWGSTLIRW